ncbi:MAG: hypothetical protein QW745_06600 [Thermoplasmata archaeon]
MNFTLTDTVVLSIIDDYKDIAIMYRYVPFGICIVIWVSVKLKN